MSRLTNNKYRGNIPVNETMFTNLLENRQMQKPSPLVYKDNELRTDAKENIVHRSLFF